MFDFDAIMVEFYKTFGWVQNPDPKPDALLFSEPFTGTRDLNDVHPLLTPRNLISTCTDFCELYPSDTLTRNALFTEEIKRKTKGFVMSALEQWEAEKLINARKNVIESNTYFNGGDISDLIRSEGLSVGLEILPRQRSRELKTNITQLGFTFDRAFTFDLRIFELGKSIPIKTIPVTYEIPFTELWIDLDIKLSGDSAYWFVYTQGDAQAINTLSAGTKYSDYFTAIPFRTAENTNTLWNLKDENEYTYHENFGINFKYSSQCEFTEFVISNFSQFHNLLSLSVAIGFLRTFAHNPNARSNRYERQFDTQQILFEIEGNPQGRKTGLNYRYEQALKAMKVSTEAIDEVCLPCRDAKRKIRYSNVGGIKVRKRDQPLFRYRGRTFGGHSGTLPEANSNTNVINASGTAAINIPSQKLLRTIVTIPNTTGAFRFSAIVAGGSDIDEIEGTADVPFSLHINEFFPNGVQLHVTGDAQFIIYIE